MKFSLTRSMTLAAALTMPMAVPAADPENSIHVFKSPTCGCCGDWVDHLRENGFDVEVTDTNNLNPIKQEAGLTPALSSCHTAFIGDYVIEGHVPAKDIRQLIEEAPQARGLAVPGMPMGSPGMEMGDRVDAYNVILFNEEGQTKVFSQYP